MRKCIMFMAAGVTLSGCSQPRQAATLKVYFPPQPRKISGGFACRESGTGKWLCNTFVQGEDRLTRELNAGKQSLPQIFALIKRQVAATADMPRDDIDFAVEVQLAVNGKTETVTASGSYARMDRIFGADQDVRELYDRAIHDAHLEPSIWFIELAHTPESLARENPATLIYRGPGTEPRPKPTSQKGPPPGD